MNASAKDQAYMQQALDLAIQGQGWVEPNPMVGCVLVHNDKIIGSGFHQKFGGPHAEVEALASCGENSPEGATAYVTLEPCCHHGKTPPCSQALIHAGVRRVVVAMQDPFAQVSGGGIRQLRDAGIQVDVGDLESAAVELNEPYLKRVRTSIPWVIAKWAMTLDGRIATVAGQSQWISNEQSRSQVHQLRGRVDVIAAGMGTVATDDPLLTARPSGPRVAQRLVFCRHRLPAIESRLMTTIDQAPVCLSVSPEIPPSQWEPHRQQGAQVIVCQSSDPVDMVGQTLRELDATNLMLEGGGELFASFLAAGQMDECQVYVGAKVFGGRNAPGPVAGEGVQRIIDAPLFRLHRSETLGEDVRLIYRRKHAN